MRRFFVCTAFFAVSCLTLPSGLLAHPVEDDTWLRIETEHFTFFSNLTESEVASFTVGLEEMYTFLTQLTMQSQLLPRKPAFFFVFKDQDSYDPYRTVASGRKPDATAPDAGYVVPRDHALYSAVYGYLRSDPVQLIYKQLIHYLLHSQTGSKLPLWLRHGIAELYSTFELEDGAARVGLPKFTYIDWLRLPRKKLMPLAELFHLDDSYASADPESTRYVYAQCWALVHYLQLGPDGLEKSLRSYVAKMLAGHSHDEAFSQSFAMDETMLEQALMAYVRQDRFKYLQAQTSTRADSSAKVTPLASHEALCHLADLLLNVAPERLSQARDHLKRALELTPDYGPAWAGLGYLAELEKRWEDAESAYARAIALGGDDALLCYRHGTSLLKTFHGPRPEGETELARLATALARLERATELDPDFAEAWAELGYAYGLEEKPDPKGIAALERARELLPAERTDLILNLLLAYARAGDPERVDSLFDELTQAGADASTLGRAQEIRLRLAYQQAVRLLNQKQVDDAIALLVEIQTETKDPALRQHVETQLAKLAISAEVLRFAELYGEVVALLGERQFAALRPLLDELRQVARPGRQTESVRRLMTRVERAQLDLMEE